MAGSSTAPTPALFVPPPDPSTSTATITTTTKSRTERTCDLDCIDINHPLHTFAEPVNDDFDPISLGRAMTTIIMARRLINALDRRMSVPISSEHRPTDRHQQQE